MKESLGQLLLADKIISESQLKEALEYVKDKNVHLGDSLLKLSIITEEQLLTGLAKQKSIDFVSLRDFQYDPDVISKVSEKYAHKYKFFPVSITGNILRVATSQPYDLQTIDDLSMVLGFQIEQVLAVSSDVDNALHNAYGIGADTIQSIIDKDVQEVELRKEAKIIESIHELTDEASITNFVNQLIVGALNSRATDIHIEPYEESLRIRYRIDGILYSIPVPSGLLSFHSEIVSRIKVMSQMNIAEKRLPQDGRSKMKINGVELDLRISILPSSHGETVSIRLLNKTNILSQLEKLGISDIDQQIVENTITKPHGILLVTGPTGSGKTTTLYCCLNKLNNMERKIITIEDPIEYDLGGITQIQVHPKIGLSFSNGLRSMLRHDPDVMMVGEIRDIETARIAVQVALTGHLVLSSVHTNNAVSTIARLTNMEIEPYLIASSIECIIAQRLVRLICTNCKETVATDTSVSREFKELADVPAPKELLVGKGCSLCNYTGYMGRTGIYEIITLNSDLREAIIKKESLNEIKRIASESGMRTLKQDGLNKVIQGKTTLEEVLRVTQETS